MKTNFSSGTVSGNVSFSFEEMKVLTNLFETAALESVENGNAQTTIKLCELSERLGFEIDIEAPDFTAEPAGQDSDPID